MSFEPFKPLFRNPHLATIAGNFWRRPESEQQWPVETLVYQTEPGVRVLIHSQRPIGTPKGELILVHGLEGSSASGYARSMVHAALDRGWATHRFNMRGCGGVDDLAVTGYHAGQTSDLLAFLDSRRRATSLSTSSLPIFLIGFSLGGNVTLKLAGELGEGAQDLLTGVCAVSTPIDLAACVAALGQPRNRIYQNRFLDRLKDRIRRKNRLSPDVYTLEHLPKIKSIEDFDDHYTARLFGFGTAANYFRTQSSSQFLERIRVPTLLVQSKDDPLIPFRVFDHPAIRGNPYLTLLAVEHGGHLGFLSRGKARFWLDATVLDWGGRPFEREKELTFSEPRILGLHVKSNASFFEAARVALDSLRGSKLRSFLTLLGIILSTTTLISVMAVIHGMDVVVATSASTMGTEGFRVLRFAFIGTWDPKKFLELQRKNPELSLEEYDFLKSRVTLVKEMSPSSQRGVKLTYEGDLVDGVALISFNSTGASLSNTEIDAGRMFTDTEDNRHMEVVVLGADLKNRFFPNVDAIGKTVQIDGRPFQVIGVAKSKGSVFGQSQDNFVSIPIQTHIKIYGARSGLQFNLSALNKDRMMEAEDEVRVLLRTFRHLHPDQDDTFMIISSDTLISAWNSLTGAIAAAAIGIVSVFMVVGGVVIMNIMLAVVSERTREIGVRKSVGARRQDILNQFLVESSTLAGIGGLIGVTISWLIALIVRNTTLVPMETPLNGVIIGVTLSVAVGLFFGIYPARRASRLDPIVALRSES